MREILEEAHKHMEDGFGRAQKHTQQERRKRFYDTASVAEVEGGFEVHLDGRSTKTPSKKMFLVPSRGVAELVVEEWMAQVDVIEPLSMPMLRLVNAAIEGGEGTAQALRDEIVKYAGNDLLLFRAESPRELVALQELHWDDALGKLTEHFDVKFQSVVGILHQDQPEITLQKLAANLEPENHFALTALTSITGLTGSGLLAIAVQNKLMEADAVWAVAHVDEDYNISQWGEDFEAVARREQRFKEFSVAVKLFSLVAA